MVTGLVRRPSVDGGCMGFIFLGIALLAIFISAVGEFRRRNSSSGRTAYAKTKRTIRVKDRREK